MKLTLICKGGVNSGLGHLHRAVSFVENTQSFAEYTLIALVDKGLENLFRNLSNVHFVYDEADLLKALTIVPDECRGCLLDMTELSDESCLLLRRRFDRLFSLSPLFSNYGILDVLFTRFSDFDYPAHLRVFSGFPYAIINTHCKLISDEVYKYNLDGDSLNIGISMGGVDAPNKSLHVLRALSSLDFDCTFFVLLGEGYAHSYQEMVDTIRRDTNHEIVLAKSNRSMWKILSNCSLAILAGGITSFEAIYAGLPCINIFEKPIHHDVLLGEVLYKKVAINLGLFNAESLHVLNAHLKVLNATRGKLLEMRENSRGLLDKQGPERTLERIREVMAELG